MTVKIMSPLRGYGILCARPDRGLAPTARECRPSGASLLARPRSRVGLLLLAVLSSGCGERGSPFAEGDSAEAEDTRARVVTQAMLHPWPRTIRAQGSLVEDEQAQLGVKVAGRVKEVLV